MANRDTINYVGTTFTVTRTLDSAKIKNATDLYVAGTFLHEVIHAYMATVMLRVKQGVTLANIQAMTYDSLFNEYIDTLTARNAPTLTNQSFPQRYQHNYMQSKLLDAIAEALKTFDDNRIGDDEYYWYIAWKGLFKTDAFEQHWPNFDTWPIVGAPLTTNDSTRGMTYALTPARLLNINNAIYEEKVANNLARGNKPVPGGCY